MKEFLLVFPFLLMNGSKLFPTSSLPYPACLYGNMAWVSLGSRFFLWCNCTKLMGKHCHGLTACSAPHQYGRISTLPVHRGKEPLVSVPEGFYQPSPPQKDEEGCLGYYEGSWEISKGHSVSHWSAMLSRWDLHTTGRPGEVVCFKNFVCWHFKPCPWEVGRERQLCLKRQHSCFSTFFFCLGRSSLSMSLGDNPQRGPPVLHPTLHRHT